MEERPQAFLHVGLLFNAPLGYSRRVALYLVIRRIQIRCFKGPPGILWRLSETFDYSALPEEYKGTNTGGQGLRYVRLSSLIGPNVRCIYGSKQKKIAGTLISAN